MTDRLIKGMYTKYPSRDRSELFGLHDGQVRAYDFIHNGGWYNLTGESLGYGDLSIDDLETIALSLNKGEVFIVLRESDRYWSLEESDRSMEAPGFDYVAEHATYIVKSCEVYHVSDSWRFSPRELSWLNHRTGARLPATCLHPDEARMLLESMTATV